MSDDLISRQDVIDELKAMYLYHASEKWREEASDDTIKARAESCMASLVEMKLRIEKLPSAQPEQKWIPCSERLPEQGKSVLVTYVYNGKRFVAESWYIGQHDERGNPLFSSCADEYKASDLYFQKVAWMPLPEPWKGAER